MNLRLKNIIFKKKFEICLLTLNIKEIENHFKLYAFFEYPCIFCKKIIIQIN